MQKSMGIGSKFGLGKELICKYRLSTHDTLRKLRAAGTRHAILERDLNQN